MEPGPPAGGATLGRQALVLLVAVVAGLALGTVVASPFDIDVGAGHAILHLVFATSIAVAAVSLWRHGTGDPASRFARWCAAALATAQLAEGVAAIPDPRGGSVAHEVPNVVSLIALQLLVLVAVIVLVVQAFRRRSA